MKELYFNELKVRLYGSVSGVNDCAKVKDLNRNHVNYGSAIEIARFMRDFGHNVDLPVYEDEGFLKITKIRIDGKVWIEFEK